MALTDGPVDGAAEAQLAPGGTGSILRQEVPSTHPPLPVPVHREPGLVRVTQEKDLATVADSNMEYSYFRKFVSRGSTLYAK